MKRSLLVFFLFICSQGFTQSVRYRLTSEIQKEIISPGKEKQLAFNLWLDKNNTLEVQAKNMIMSINDKVFIFNILQRDIVSSNQIKYIVYIPSSKVKSEIWQITQPDKSVHFEVYKNESFYVRYIAIKLK